MKFKIVTGTAVLLCFVICGAFLIPTNPSATVSAASVKEAASSIPVLEDNGDEELCYVRVTPPSPTPEKPPEVDSTEIALYALAKQNGVTLPEDLSQSRKAVLKAALAGALHGVPYYYTWRSYTVSPGLKVNEFGEELGVSDGNPNRTEKGLDCSGFVGWAYYTAGITWSDLACGGDADGGYIFKATPSMRATEALTEITFEEMKPGDIGFIGNTASGKSDHTGIFLGMNTEGVATWVHCSGSQGAVCNTYGGFQVFYRVKDMED